MKITEPVLVISVVFLNLHDALLHIFTYRLFRQTTSMKYVLQPYNQSHAKYIKVYFHNAFKIGAKHATGAQYSRSEQIKRGWKEYRTLLKILFFFCFDELTTINNKSKRLDINNINSKTNYHHFVDNSWVISTEKPNFTLFTWNVLHCPL